jgi:hypothetical protein
MGLGTRANALQRAAASPEHGDALAEAAARLVDPAGMGKEYKVMGLTGGAACTADAEGSLLARYGKSTQRPCRHSICLSLMTLGVWGW